MNHMPKKLFKVIKWNGETEFFQAKKLLKSLKQSGASNDLAVRILEHIEKELVDGMKTHEIYQHAFELLRKDVPGVAARYDLKKAILRLGPTGFPFELFVASIWKRLGYQVEVGKIVSGRCIEHEVDIIAENDKEVIMMECKYHNYHNAKSDIKIALYVNARMEDLKAHWQKKHPDSQKKFVGCLMTNTKISTSALQYANCAGLRVISWSYPPGAGLAQIIDKVGLHPITCLTSLTEGHIRTLLNHGVVLCKDLEKHVKELNLSEKEHENVNKEIQELCDLEI